MKRLARVVLVLVFLFAGRIHGTDAIDNQVEAETPGFAEAVALLETWIESIVDYDRIPGMSVAIVHDQEIVYSRGFGHIDRERRVAAAPDTVFGVCSLAKVFTAIAVMQLRDAGKLSLDDPVSRHLNWFKPNSPGPDPHDPTLRDILRHSGGLPCEPGNTVWTDPEELYPSRDELRARVSGIHLSHPPNTTFNYSNLGYALLGQVVTEVAGIGYAEYVRLKILDPLGLEATTPFIPEGDPSRAVSPGYGPRPRAGSRTNIDNIDQRSMVPASGFASTAEDMARFAMWQFRALGGQETAVLNGNTLREMHSIQWQDPSWGLGFTIWRMGGSDFVGHQGGCFGYQSQLILNPVDKTAVVVLANAWDAPQFTLAFRSYEIMAPVLGSRHAETVEPQPWKEYAGFYTSENSWSEAEVLSWQRNLAVMWVPGSNPDPIGSLVRLIRVDGEVFRQIGADGKLGKHYVFRRDATGNVVGFKFNSNLLSRADR